MARLNIRTRRSRARIWKAALVTVGEGAMLTLIFVLALYAAWDLVALLGGG